MTIHHSRTDTLSILGNGVYSIETEGGASRARRTVLGSVDKVNVVWRLSPVEYAELVFMVDHQLARGTIPFLIDLAIDNGRLTEYTAQISKNTFGLRGQAGLAYTVGATLLVQRPPLTERVRIYTQLIGDLAFSLTGTVQEAMEEVKKE